MPDNIVYASIGTVNKSRVDDGVLTFEASKATGPDLDADGQRVNMAWARKAMGDWFDTGGNIREQHDAHRAVGKAMVLEERADGLYTSGKIVDPLSIRKVEEGVLTGLSIGIRGGRVENGEIVGGKIVELSLCDRPSNPTTRLVLAKADGPDDAFEAVEELIEEEKAERVEHSHSHEHSDGHHRHQHTHGPGVAEHRALASGVPHNHQHTADNPDVVADREQGLSDADTESPSKAIDADMVKAVLSAADRAALPASDFAIPSKRPGPGSYPINDESHARDALARSKGKPEEGTVRAAVKRKYPDMEVEGSDKADEPDQEQIEGDLALMVKAAKPTNANPDPDGNGDDDRTPAGDTDHDYWNEDGTPTAKGKAAGLKQKAVEPDPVVVTLEPQIGEFDIIKSLTADPAMVAELRKALGIDEAESKRQEEITDLKSQLEKALDVPIGQPVRTRPGAAAATVVAKTDLMVKRDRYKDLADAALDPTAYAGYMAKAERIDEELQKLA